MECEAALKYNAGLINFSSLNPSYLAVLIQPARFTIMFYDYFLTVGLEIKFVWPSKWSLAKALYFTTTYFNFVTLTVSTPGFLSRCSRNPKTNAILEVSLGLITLCIAESVLLLRTWVLWERNKKTGIGLLVLFAFLSIPCSTFIALGIRQQDVAAGPQPIMGSITFFGFILVAVYETVMLTLIIFKAKQHFARAPKEYFSLTCVLFRDGIVYYIVLISFSLTITGLMADGNLPVVIDLSLLHVTLHSVLTKRMFLNLRSVAFQDSYETWAPNSTFMAVSGFQFASRSDVTMQSSSYPLVK
ncbi:hypothetical protein K439DRAFT_1639515 [Ramaria rubella]|nr:hypothetical protein K439DRAFT_1639515 [Ramaria rubella]